MPREGAARARLRSAAEKRGAEPKLRVRAARKTRGCGKHPELVSIQMPFARYIPRRLQPGFLTIKKIKINKYKEVNFGPRSHARRRPLRGRAALRCLSAPPPPQGCGAAPAAERHLAAHGGTAAAESSAPPAAPAEQPAGRAKPAARLAPGPWVTHAAAFRGSCKKGHMAILACPATPFIFFLLFFLSFSYFILFWCLNFKGG